MQAGIDLFSRTTKCRLFLLVICSYHVQINLAQPSPGRGRRYLTADRLNLFRNECWAINSACVYDNNGYGACKCWCQPGHASYTTRNSHNRVTKVECTICAVGFYQYDFTSRSQCNKCNSGRITQQVGADHPNLCQDCPVGTKELGQKCELCTGRDYGRLPAQTTCDLCGSGHEIVTAGAGGVADCVACKEGKYYSYSDNPNDLACFDCIPGKISTSEGQEACQSCWDDSSATLNHTAKAACVQNYVQDVFFRRVHASSKPVREILSERAETDSNILPTGSVIRICKTTDQRELNPVVLRRDEIKWYPVNINPSHRDYNIYTLILPI